MPNFKWNLCLAYFHSFHDSSVTGERMAVGVTILLSLAVFFLMVEEKMPVAENLPLIGKYYCCTIIEVSMSLVAMCHVLRFVHNRPRALPDWVQVSCNENAPTLLIVYWGANPSGDEG